MLYSFFPSQITEPSIHIKLASLTAPLCSTDVQLRLLIYGSVLQYSSNDCEAFISMRYTRIVIDTYWVYAVYRYNLTIVQALTLSRVESFKGKNSYSISLYI